MQVCTSLSLSLFLCFYVSHSLLFSLSTLCPAEVPLRRLHCVRPRCHYIDLTVSSRGTITSTSLCLAWGTITSTSLCRVELPLRRRHCVRPRYHYVDLTVSGWVTVTSTSLCPAEVPLRRRHCVGLSYHYVDLTVSGWVTVTSTSLCPAEVPLHRHHCVRPRYHYVDLSVLGWVTVTSTSLWLSLRHVLILSEATSSCSCRRHEFETLPVELNRKIKYKNKR